MAKNHQEIESIAKKFLDSEAEYVGYVITTNQHVIGTSIDTVEAKVGNLTVTLTINHESGEIMDVKKTRLHERSFLEQVRVTDTFSAQSSAYFALEQSITIHGHKINSDDIELVFDQSNPTTLVGFRITLNDGTGADLESAYQKARRLTNFLSLKTGIYLDHKRPEMLIAKSDHMERTKSFTVDVVLSRWIDLDLTDNNMVKLLDDDDPLFTQQIADAVTGFQAYDDSNFKDAIRNFWLVIEDEDLSLPKKYKFLRDGLSHKAITNSDAQKELQNVFRLNCKPKTDHKTKSVGIYVDTVDPNNRRIIHEEATFLREKVIKLLESKLQ